MSIRFKKKNTLLTYSKGMTRDQVAHELQKRIDKREKELEKREWIYKEYLNLIKSQENDKQWLNWVLQQDPETW